MTTGWSRQASSTVCPTGTAIPTRQASGAMLSRLPMPLRCNIPATPLKVSPPVPRPARLATGCSE